MRIKDSTFFQLLILAIFAIAILHVSLKNLLHEPIFRFEETEKKDIQRHIEFNVNNVQERDPTLHADSKEDLMRYIKKNIKDIARNKDIHVKGANYFSPFHQSDLHHEETDLSKYFQIDQSVPTTTNMLKSLECNRGDDTCKAPVIPQTDNLTGNPLYFDQGSNGDLTYKPDIWVYDNERPMNGGEFDGVRGIDGMQSDFSIYSNSNGGGLGLGESSNYQSSYPYIQSTGKW